MAEAVRLVRLFFYWLSPVAGALLSLVKSQDLWQEQSDRLGQCWGRYSYLLISCRWEQPDHSGENIISYELYWNDTYTATVSHKAWEHLENLELLNKLRV